MEASLDEPLAQPAEQLESMWELNGIHASFPSDLPFGAIETQVEILEPIC